MVRLVVIVFVLAFLLLGVMQLVNGQSECDLPLEERPDNCFSTPAAQPAAATETPSMAIRTPYPEPDPYPLNSLQLRSSRQRQELNSFLKTVFAFCNENYDQVGEKWQNAGVLSRICAGSGAFLQRELKR